MDELEPWSDAKYLERAAKEPERLNFWLEYEPDILEASKSVCDNPPDFDAQWRAMWTPKQFKKLQKDNVDENGCIK